ncbi:Replication factor A, C-terminal [Globisporangium polare]
MQRNGKSNGGSNAFEFVPSAVVERAFVHNMVYAACPKCSASLQAQMQAQANGGGVTLSSAITRAAAVLPANVIECTTCGTWTRVAAVQYKFRLKIRVAYGASVVDAMLFDEIAQEFIGANATRLQTIQLQYPSLPWLLEELLVGLRVSFRCQRPQDRASSTGGAPTYTKDLKIVKIAPLANVLLPKSPLEQQRGPPQRLLNKVWERTESAWTPALENPISYTNPLYKMTSDVLYARDSMKHMVLWRGMFLRWDPEQRLSHNKQEASDPAPEEVSYCAASTEATSRDNVQILAPRQGTTTASSVDTEINEKEQKKGFALEDEMVNTFHHLRRRTAALSICTDESNGEECE